MKKNVFIKLMIIAVALLTYNFADDVYLSRILFINHSYYNLYVFEWKCINWGGVFRCLKGYYTLLSVWFCLF